MPAVEIENDTTTVDSTGDHDRFAHYVERDQITEAIVNGIPVIALCGKIWIPSRDPNKYPVCPTCREILASFYT
jgi:hypothetical protein